MCECVSLGTYVCLVGITGGANEKPGDTEAHRAALQCTQAFCAEINLLLLEFEGITFNRLLCEVQRHRKGSTSPGLNGSRVSLHWSGC